MEENFSPFEPWLALWGLTPDGAPLAGNSSRLLTWVMGQAALWEAWSAPGRDWLAITEVAGRALDEVRRC